MKKLLLCFLQLTAISFGQTPIYQNNFRDSNPIIGTGSFNFTADGSPNNLNYVSDRNEMETNALYLFKYKGTATISSLPIGNAPRTISCWVNHKSTASVSLFSYGNANAGQAFGFDVYPTNNQIGFFGYGGVAFDKFITHTTILNTWIHYAVTFDGSNVKVYVNGQLKGGPYPMTLNTQNSAFRLGIGVDGIAKTGNIEFDALNIFSSALTDAQIKTLYRQYDNQTPVQAGIPTNGLVYANHFKSTDIFESPQSPNRSDSSITGAIVASTNSIHNLIENSRNFAVRQTMEYDINNYGNDLKIGADLGNTSGDFAVVLKVKVDAAYSNALAPGQYITFYRNGSIFIRMLKTASQDFVLQGGYVSPSTNNYVISSGNIGSAINGWNTIILNNNNFTNTCQLSINNTQLLAASSDYVSYADISSQKLILGIDGIANQSFAGQLDDVLMYNRALTPTEINSFSTTLSSEKFVNNLKFNIYPNPANDFITVDLDNEVKSIEIYNLQGQKVKTSNQKQTNVSDLASGIYMVRIQDENNSIATQKIVKQ